MNYNEINEDINFWTGTDTSSNSFFDTSERLLRINQAYREVDQAIWSASSDWEHDDSGFGTLPIGIASLVDGQGNYEIPTSAHQIMSVSVKDDSGDWKRLDWFDQSQLSQDYDEFLENDGLPKFFDVISNSIQLKPAPAGEDVTTTSGLKIHLSRGVNEFSSTSTTREPGFNNDFHQLLSLIPSYDYLIRTNAEAKKLDRVKGKINELKEQLGEHYSNRGRFKEGRWIPRSLKGGDGSFRSSI